MQNQNFDTEYQKVLATQKQIVYAQLGRDSLKIKVTMKTKDNGNQIYECVIRNSDIEGKLNEYFEHLKELKEYMKTPDNVKIDQAKKMLDIIAKGPTKRASFILLAQFKLTLIEKNHKNEKQSIVLTQTEEWIDNLANEIIGIIEYKSKTKDKQENLKHLISKNEMDEAIEQLRRELKSQIERNKQQIAKLQSERINSETKNILHQIEDMKEKEQIEAKDKLNQILLIEKLKKEELAAIQIKIKTLEQKLESKIEKTNLELIAMIREEEQRLHQNFARQINIKINQISTNFSTKDEIDAIIKKVQNVGNKLESICFQNSKKVEKDTLNERLYMQEKKITEIEERMVKSKSVMESSPRPKSSLPSDFTPSNWVSAESWIDSTCSHFGRVTLKENTITMISYGNARLFGKIPIKQKPIFHVLIESMANRMALGVIDPSYKDNVIFGEEPNIITYQSDKRSWNGKKEKLDQGEGFKAEEIVTVSVDPALGTILWKVGSTLRYSWQNDDLRNNKIKWVPFIKMYDKGDKISLVE